MADVTERPESARVTLVLGGARSGKSRAALELLGSERDVAFLATARAGDEEMRERIAAHRAERPNSWRTIEEPRDLAERISAEIAPHEAVVLDCLTVWVAGFMGPPEQGGGRRSGAGIDHRNEAGTEASVLGRTEALLEAIADHGRRWVIVSNETGAGVHPATAVGRRFRDLLGLVNQRVAAEAGRVLYMVAGLPLQLKPRDGRAPPG